MTAWLTALPWWAWLPLCAALHWTHLALGVYDPGGPTGWRKRIVCVEEVLGALGCGLWVLSLLR